MARYGIRPLDGTHESYASTLREGVSNGRIKASGLEVEAEYVMAASDTNTRDFGWVLGVGLVLVGAQLAISRLRGPCLPSSFWVVQPPLSL